MIDQLQHQLEIGDSAATLYLAGGLRGGDVQRLRALCFALPPRVVTLRVDLHAMRSQDPAALTALRGALHEWRAARHGDFRLSLCTSHLVATYREGIAEAPPAKFGAPPRVEQHALMGTFL